MLCCPKIFLLQVFFLINSLQNNKILNWPNSKALKKKIKLAKMMIFILVREFTVKNLCEKEKMLVTSIFSFSHNVFIRLLTQGCYKSRHCGKGLSLKKATYAPMLG